MFKTNAKYGASHEYFDIAQFTDKSGKVKWIAWYYRDFKNLDDLDGN